MQDSLRVWVLLKASRGCSLLVIEGVMSVATREEKRMKSRRIKKGSNTMKSGNEKETTKKKKKRKREREKERKRERKVKVKEMMKQRE